MAKRKKKNITKKFGVFDKLRLTESYTSLILGAIVVLVLGILFLIFAKSHRNIQVSSTFDKEIKIAKEVYENSKTSSTYTVNPGDDLWSISEKVYKDGFKWNEIARVNKLENPGLIYAGDKLVIPTVTPIVAEEKQASITEAQIFATDNSSITSNSYTIKSGDNLWDIAVRAYGDGFRYPEIAKANNLENPSLIFSGNILKIPRP